MEGQKTRVGQEVRRSLERASAEESYAAKQERLRAASKWRVRKRKLKLVTANRKKALKHVPQIVAMLNELATQTGCVIRTTERNWRNFQKWGFYYRWNIPGTLLDHWLQECDDFVSRRECVVLNVSIQRPGSSDAMECETRDIIIHPKGFVNFLRNDMDVDQYLHELTFGGLDITSCRRTMKRLIEIASLRSLDQESPRPASQANELARPCRRSATRRLRPISPCHRYEPHD